MIKLNPNLKNLKKNYLFVDIQKKTDKFISENPDAEIIKMGIGDVTLPLCETVVQAMKKAAEEMGNKETFRGYGPYEGYEFLKEAISEKYKSFGAEIEPGEVYVSDGSKNDVANVLDIFAKGSEVLITDPVYPVYLDSNVMAGNSVKYAEATKDNDFLPMPSEKSDIIYLCSPNNPTGAVYTKEQLKKWVDFATENGSLIIFDAAYEAFIEDENLPHSIFEIEGAEKCAVELSSFSKAAGFTGVRCAYMIIPNELEISGEKLGDVWLRRQSIKFNGVSYVTQAAAFASLSEKGKEETAKAVKYYKENAKIIAKVMTELGLYNIGSENSPYIWVKAPNGMTSWEFFDYLLKEANIVCTPGSGFGPSGEGFVRISSFNSRENTLIAAERLKKLKF